jgi:hypothetical protein
MSRRKRKSHIEVKVSKVLTGYQIPIIKNKTVTPPLLGTPEPKELSINLIDHVGNGDCK